MLKHTSLQQDCTFTLTPSHFVSEAFGQGNHERLAIKEEYMLKHCAHLQLSLRSWWFS